jgi:hypothetical protein
MPDGWGNLLLDRMLIRKGIRPGSLSPLDKLSIVGSSGMGALTYHPANSTLTSLSFLSKPHTMSRPLPLLFFSLFMIASCRQQAKTDLTTINILDGLKIEKEFRRFLPVRRFHTVPAIFI